MATFQIQMPTTGAAAAFEAVLATGNVEAIAAVWQALKATAPESAPAAPKSVAEPVAATPTKPTKKAAKTPAAPKKAAKAPKAPVAPVALVVEADHSDNDTDTDQFTEEATRQSIGLPAKPKAKAPAIDKKAKRAAKRAAKDPDAPKRAMTAYQAYFAVEMVSLREAAARHGYPVKTKEEGDALMRECGRSWKALPAMEQEKWAAVARQRNQDEGRVAKAPATFPARLAHVCD